MSKYEIRRLNLKYIIDLMYDKKISNFSRASGINESYLGRMLYTEGKSGKKNIGDNMVEKILETINEKPGWLDIPHWTDNIIDNIELEQTQNLLLLGSLDVYDNDSPIRDDEVELPFFREVELAGGSGVCEVRENYYVKIRFPRSELKKRNILPAHAACVRVSGNSMEPAYPHGSIVGIDTNSTEIKDGEHYAIDHNGYLRVKIVYKLPNGGLRLRSFNREEWPDENLSKDEPIRIIGRVFWSSGFR